MFGIRVLAVCAWAVSVTWCAIGTSAQGTQNGYDFRHHDILCNCWTCPGHQPWHWQGKCIGCWQSPVPSSKMYLGNLGIASLANVHFWVWCPRYLVHKLRASGWGDGVFWVDQQLTQCLIWLERGADLKWRQDFPYCLWYMSHIWEDYSSLGLLTVSGLLAGGLGLAFDELG